MRRCEDCKHSRCAVSMTPCLPDLWVCRARGGMDVPRYCGRCGTRVRVEEE